MHRFVFSCLAVACLVILLGGVCSTPPPSAHFAKRLPSAIENFALVGNGIYRGAQPDKNGINELKRLGVKTVIDFRTSERDEYDELLSKCGIEHIKIPISDIGSGLPTEEQIKKFLEILCDEAKKPVFFHCRRGVDRTGTFCALYRIEHDGWKNTEAIKEMKYFGFNPTFYPGFYNFILAYKPHILRQTSPQKGDQTSPNK
jgi:protein tyrosine/serine phosphatase